MEGLTASEIAGFGVGALLLFSTVAAPKLDAFFSSQQRRYLHYILLPLSLFLSCFQ